MTGRISAFAMEAIGFVGIILTNTCMIVGASFTFGAASPGRAIPIPGWITLATAKPITIAIAVVTI